MTAVLETDHAPGRAPAPTEKAPLVGSPAERFPCIDGIRAIAAVAVLLQHALPALHPSWLTPGIQTYTSRLGNYGVTVFFVLSGFLLYRPFVERYIRGDAAPSLRTFYRRRFFRIFPAYWLALSALLFLFQFQHAHGWRDYFTYYGLLQNYRRFYTLSGLLVAWTLVIEVSFYAALPGLAWLIRRIPIGRRTGSGKWRAQLVGVGLMYLTGTLYRAAHPWLTRSQSGSATREWFPLAQSGSWLPNVLDLFALGMLLAVVSVYAAQHRLPRLFAALVEMPAACWFFSAELYWMATNLHIRTTFGSISPNQLMWLSVLHGLSAALLVAPAVLGNPQNSFVHRVLRSTPFRRTGEVAFGIYLWHLMCLTQVLRWAKAGAISSHALPEFLILIAMTFAFASFSYYAVERPLIRWSRHSLARLRLGRRGRPTDTVDNPDFLIAQKAAAP